MHLQQPGLTLMDTPQGASAVRAATSGNEIVYAGVFPNVDLRYWLGMSHVEEMLLLQSAQVPASYTFSYHVPGASAHQDASGAVIITDAQGHILGAIGGIPCWLRRLRHAVLQ